MKAATTLLVVLVLGLVLSAQAQKGFAGGLPWGLSNICGACKKTIAENFFDVAEVTSQIDCADWNRATDTTSSLCDKMNIGDFYSACSMLMKSACNEIVEWVNEDKSVGQICTSIGLCRGSDARTPRSASTIHSAVEQKPVVNNDANEEETVYYPTCYHLPENIPYLSINRKGATNNPTFNVARMGPKFDCTSFDTYLWANLSDMELQQPIEGVSFSVAPNCRIQVDVDPERYDVVKDEMDGSAAIIIKMNARVGGCTAVFAVDFQE